LGDGRDGDAESESEGENGPGSAEQPNDTHDRLHVA